ncbi:division/cell wall cluster transcriptional repressor MraZ [Qipengyuania sp. JC766]|uniref:division/cell wall cluster transcriptional repressor MraZ n=1 Tax=Qipengyuania sp. JC766 TaxID=3232139 RepID=UPI00345AD497
MVKEAGEGTKKVCIGEHPKWPCLTGFGLDHEKERRERLDREYDLALQNGRDFDYEERSDKLFGFEKIPFDDSGRFVLSTWLQRYANVTEGLYFRGSGRTFTIWAPEELYKMGPEMEAAKIACQTLVEDYEAKRK